MGEPKLPLEKEKRVDVLSEASDLPGLGGHLERFLRRFRLLGFLLCLLPITLIIVGIIGCATVPGIALFYYATDFSSGWPLGLKFLTQGMSLSLGYVAYGFSVIFLVPLVNFVLPLRLKPFRGSWYSLGAIPWYVHNALTYVPRYTFLDLITPTPITNLFYRMMGMKIGKGVVINTTNISDPCLITLGDYVTLGGSCTVFAHYGQKGYLVISEVVIKKGATIGLHASVMGETVIGENVIVRPHQVVMPKTSIPDNTTF